MSDGKVVIETELDSSGFQAGLRKLGGLAKTGLKTTMAAIAGAGAAFAGLGGAAVKVGMDFESAFAGVKKTIDATPEQLDEIKTSLLNLSKQIPLTSVEIAGIAEAAGQLGIKTENVEKFTRVMADLGVATNLSSDEAATSLARLANITGMSQENFDRLGSVIVALGNNLATTESEIVAMGLRLAGAGKQIGLSESQIMSFAGALSSVGIEAEAGGSAFSTLMVNMQLACETGNESLQEFASVAGMSVEEFKTAFEKDAGGAILMFLQGLATCEEQGISSIKVLDDMGITEIRLRDALLRASGASDVFSESLRLGNAAWEENNALTKEAEQRYETTESKLILLKNSLSVLGTQIYDSVNTPIRDVIESATGMVEQLSKAFEKDGLSGLVAEFGDVLSQVAVHAAKSAPKMMEAGTDMILAFLDGIQFEKDGLSGLVAEFGDVLSQVAVHAAKSAPKMMEAGTDMILAFLDGIQKNSKQISSAMVEIGKAMLSAIVQIVPKVAAIGKELIVGFVNAILGANAAKSVGQMIDSILAAFQSLLQSAQKVWSALKPILSGLVQVISNLAQVILPVFTGAIQLLADNAQGLIPIVMAAAGAFAAFKILSTVTTIINTAKTAYVAFQAVLSATNPIMLVIGALGGLAALLTGVFCSSADEATAAAERLEESQKALGERMVEIGDDIQEFREGVASAGSILDDLNSSVVVSAEEQQKLSSRMAEVQEKISKIAGTYSEGRKQLTQQEIEKLDQLFQEMQSLAKRELEIQKSYMDVTESMASSLVNNQSLTLEEYNKQRDYIINSAEDTKNQVVAKVQEQTRQEIALIQTRTDLTETEKQKQVDAVYARMNEEIKKAEDKEQKILGIVQGGYTDRADAFSEFVEKSAELEREYAQNTEENNQQIALLEQERVKENSGFWGSIFQNGNRHNQKIKELQTQNEEQTAAYNERIKELWNDEVQAQAAAHLEMAANQLESNGKITGEAALMVQEILKTYDQMGDEQKKAFAEACGGSLDTILEHRPGIEQAARELGENTVQSVEDGMEEKEPSLLAQTKQLSESVLNQLEGSPQKASVIGSNIALGLIQGMNNQKKSVQATAANLANIAYQAMQVVLDIHSPSRVMRDKIGKNIALGVADGIDKNAKAAAKSAVEMGNLVLQSAEKTLSNYKIYHEVALADEVAFWDEVRKQCVSRSQARMDADKKYYDAKAKLNDQMVSLEKDYSENVKKIHQGLNQEIASLIDSYNDKVESRANSIASSMSLFSEFAPKEADGQELLHNLQTQVEGLTDWTVNLEALKSRGIDKGLLEELQNMGTSAAGEIDALLSLSDDQLNQYVALWKQKQNLAKSQAISELAPLKQDIAAQIQDLTAQANQELASYNQAYVEAMAELGVTMQQPIEQLKTSMLSDGSVVVSNFSFGVEQATNTPEVVARFESVAGAVRNATASLPAEMQEKGGQIVAGLIAGMQAKEAELSEMASRLRSAVAMETSGVSAKVGSVAAHQAAMASPVSAQSAASAPVQTVDTVEAHIYVDSREAAVALVPAISKELGWKGNR